MSIRRRSLFALVACLLLGACSGTEAGTGGRPTAISPTSAPDAGFTAVSTADDDRPVDLGAPLSSVCDDRVVVQITGLPSVEHGPLFELLGDDPDVDVERRAISAPLLRVDGTEEEVVLEIRVGGPAVDFRTALDVMADDSDILLAEASTTDSVVSVADFPTTSVIALTDVSHAMVMWDPDTYPDVEGFADLVVAGVEVHHATGERFVDFLVAIGSLDPSRLEDGFFGEPARFVTADGSIAVQGDALVDPFLYPSLPQWSRPVDFVLAADAGWASYDDTLAVRTSDLDDRAPCLRLLVPLLQQAIRSYVASPRAADELMAETRERFNPLTRIEPGILDDGARAAAVLGIYDVEKQSGVGSFDIDRLASFTDALTEHLSLPRVDAGELATNRFILPNSEL